MLMFWGLCLPSPAAKSNSEIYRVPAGWTSSQAGYWLTESAARDIAAGWSADRESVRILRQGLVDLRTEVSASNADTQRLLADLRKEINNERIRYNAKIRTTKSQGVVWGLVLGVGVGLLAGKN